MNSLRNAQPITSEAAAAIEVPVPFLATPFANWSMLPANCQDTFSPVTEA